MPAVGSDCGTLGWGKELACGTNLGLGARGVSVVGGLKAPRASLSQSLEALSIKGKGRRAGLRSADHDVGETSTTSARSAESHYMLDSFVSAGFASQFWAVLMGSDVSPAGLRDAQRAGEASRPCLCEGVSGETGVWSDD